eukprot:GHVS01078115.1.p1 GENE.GHVS01078115.1~~GHVS01078115.1.p1  ORF type:complete len:179 (-),score=28.84 GHVS01078115.1:226-714(-)
MSATPPFPATAQTATGEETAKNEHTTEEAEGFRISMTPARERNLWLMDPAAYSEIEETVKQLKNSTSWFSTPEGSAPISTKPEGKEYTSHALLLADRQKQVRSTLEPRQKFDNPCLASHSVGWSSDNAEVKRPFFCIRESPTTKYYHNMEFTRSYHVLRFAR